MKYLGHFDEDKFKNSVIDFMKVILTAKSSVIMNVIEQIEKRPAILSDAENCILYSDDFYGKEVLRYKGVDVGMIEVNIEKQQVFFHPFNNKDEKRQDQIRY